MSYRKRAKGGWNQGKAYKGSRKAAEREFVKSEIAEQADPDFKYRHVGRRKPNVRVRLRNLIEYYEERVARYDRERERGIWRRWEDSVREELRRLREKFSKL